MSSHLLTRTAAWSHVDLLELDVQVVNHQCIFPQQHGQHDSWTHQKTIAGSSTTHKQHSEFLL
jgi:hypothetical protein